MRLGNTDNALVCPRDLSELRENDRFLLCAQNHRYPLIDGVPVMLIDEVPPTHGAISESIEHAKHEAAWEYAQKLNREDEIDEVAQALVAPTSGYLYRGLTGKLSRYPIPELHCRMGKGKAFLISGAVGADGPLRPPEKAIIRLGLIPPLVRFLRPGGFVDNLNLMQALS